MNTRFDKLVDGELNEEDRRRLLAGLDNEPDGWRRCALAFLESQCWKQAFGESADVPSQKQAKQIPVTPIAIAKNAAAKKSTWLSHAGMVTAVAASFIAAMWIGSAANQAWRGRMGETARTNSNRETNDLIAQFKKNPPIQSQTTPEPKTDAAEPWQVVTVSPTGDKHGERPINVPARVRDRLDDQWAANTPSAIPDDVMQSLNRTGHQVEQRRELVPVSLQDGRQMVVPVDQVNVHYVGRTY